MKHLFLSAIVLTTLLSAMPVDAKKFTVKADDCTYKYDSKKKTLIMKFKHYEQKYSCVDVTWEDNIDARTTKVTFIADKYNLNREILGIPLKLKNPKEEFMVQNLGSDSALYFAIQHYKRPDGSLVEEGRLWSRKVGQESILVTK